MATSDPPPAAAKTLNSWKEVAAYLGVSVRTAQKWEAERALPVSRVPGGARRTVFAIAAELDAWRQSGEGAAVAESGAQRRWWVVAVAICACVGIVTAGILWFGKTGKAVALRTEGATLTVLDEKGRALWQHTFGGPFYQLADYHSTLAPRLFRFADIDGDGRTEVLFIRMPDDPLSQGSTLYCFSNRGKILWKYEAHRSVRSRKESFSPLYIAKSVAVAQTGKGRPPVVVVSAVHSSWYPNQVAVLSSKGEVLREYWHSGQLNHLETADMNGDGVDEIYAAGTNNDYNQATLVVLDPNQMEGASLEAARPEYQLLGFRPPREIGRILFQRSCLVPSQAPRNVVAGLRQQQDGLVVETGEGGGGDLIYRFDGKLNLLGLDAADGFTALHSQLRQKGLLDHDYSSAELEPLKRIVYLSR